MEPNKFEQHIKEELKKRELKPASSSWDKIANQLEEPQKQRKSNYLWIGIAASFTGLLIISSIYFNYDKTDSNDNPTVVETDTENIKIIENESENLTNEIQENEIVNTNTKIQENTKVSEKIEREKPTNVIQVNESTEVAILNSELKAEINNEELNQQNLIQQKIAEVLAKVDELEQNDSTLTDLEVDSLIIQAQKEIFQNKIFKRNGTIDAMALLNEVEDELNKPLKDQMFDLLKKGIYETRNAIADRN